MEGPSPLQKANSLECRGLCADSCGPLSPLKGEEAIIRAFAEAHGLAYEPLAKHRQKALALIKALGLRRAAREQPAKVWCPYLSDGSCSIHDVRPTLCRLWGAVETAKCPYGCVPALGYVTREEARAMLGLA